VEIRSDWYDVIRRTRIIRSDLFNYPVIINIWSGDFYDKEDETCHAFAISQIVDRQFIKSAVSIGQTSAFSSLSLILLLSRLASPSPIRDSRSIKARYEDQRKSSMRNASFSRLHDPFIYRRTLLFDIFELWTRFDIFELWPDASTDTRRPSTLLIFSTQ
jgi:hypothetical protein